MDRPAPPIITSQLSAEERTVLVAGGQNPQDFAAVLVQAKVAGMQEIVEPGTGQRFIAIMFAAAIPLNTTILNFSQLLDPVTKQPMMDQRIRKLLCESPSPMLRFVGMREVLSKDVRTQLAAEDAQEAGRVAHG